MLLQAEVKRETFRGCLGEWCASDLQKKPVHMCFPLPGLLQIERCAICWALLKEAFTRPSVRLQSLLV